MAHAAILTWVKSTDDTGAAGQGYNVYKGSNPPGNEGSVPANVSLLPAGTLSYTDTAVVAGQKYDYYVTFVSNGIESAHSSEVITAVILPAAPTGLAVAIS